MPATTQLSFDDLGTPLVDVTFCVLDLETTGGSAASSAITEVGAARYRGGELLGTFQTLVNPGCPIPPFITVLTGITQAMVVEAPPIDQVLPAFLEFAQGAVLVGHNLRFDLSFLNAAAARLDYPPFRQRSVDTVALARRLVRSEVRNLQLATLAAHFRSPVQPSHRALDDALATAHVLWGLLERAGSLGVTALEDLLMLPTARGSSHYRKIHLARDLPRRPGVYLFRDRDDRVIYVGKAKNLRTRVQSYFYGDDRRSVEAMLRELHRVEHRVCQSELEAAVTELRLIYAHRPRHNRHLRPPRSAHWVTLTDERFPRLSLTRTLHPAAPLVLGPFRSRQAAELVLTALWDAVPLRRCRGRPGSRAARCAFAQLGVARCPCDGSLSEEEYAAVVEQVLTGADTRPELLLEPLARRMRELARQQRFEEAAWVRDRYQALARALERRRAWRALTRAGRLEVESVDGERAIIEDGRLVASWQRGSPAPLIPPPAPLSPTADAPPSLEVAEEVRLVWEWLGSGRVQLVDAGGPVWLPASPVPKLAAAG